MGFPNRPRAVTELAIAQFLEEPEPIHWVIYDCPDGDCEEKGVRIVSNSRPPYCSTHEDQRMVAVGTQPIEQE
jgi:hypothetical protein